MQLIQNSTLKTNDLKIKCFEDYRSQKKEKKAILGKIIFFQNIIFGDVFRNATTQLYITAL